MLMDIFGFIKPSRHTFRSGINNSISVTRFFGRSTLFAKGIPQSGGEFVRMWKTVIAGIPGLPVESALVLGVGGGTAIGILRRKYPDARITGVDIDPVVIDIAKRYFPAENTRGVTFFVSDAVTWISSQPATDRYSLIIVDLFIGLDNPSASKTAGFLKRIRQIAGRNGLIIYNSDYQPDLYPTFLNCARDIFAVVTEVFRNRYNRVLMLRK